MVGSRINGNSPLWKVFSGLVFDCIVSVSIDFLRICSWYKKGGVQEQFSSQSPSWADVRTGGRWKQLHYCYLNEVGMRIVACGQQLHSAYPNWAAFFLHALKAL